MRLRYLSDSYIVAAHGDAVADEVRSAGVHRVGGIEIDEDVYEAIVRKHYKTASPPAPGLGDYVANALGAIGITKERVSAAVGGDCGCHKRQEALNELGRKFGIG